MKTKHTYIIKLSFSGGGGYVTGSRNVAEFILLMNDVLKQYPDKLGEVYRDNEFIGAAIYDSANDRIIQYRKAN